MFGHPWIHGMWDVQCSQGLWLLSLMGEGQQSLQRPPFGFLLPQHSPLGLGKNPGWVLEGGQGLEVWPQFPVQGSWKVSWHLGSCQDLGKRDL